MKIVWMTLIVMLCCGNMAKANGRHFILRAGSNTSHMVADYGKNPAISYDAKPYPGSDTSHTIADYGNPVISYDAKPYQCQCMCCSNKYEFSVGQKVYDIINGEGVVEFVSRKQYIDYVIKVKLNDGRTYTYTRDGKRFKLDKLPSIYHQKMKIVEDGDRAGDPLYQFRYIMK